MFSRSLCMFATRVWFASRAEPLAPSQCSQPWPAAYCLHAQQIVHSSYSTCILSSIASALIQSAARTLTMLHCYENVGTAVNTHGTVKGQNQATTTTHLRHSTTIFQHTGSVNSSVATYILLATRPEMFHAAQFKLIQTAVATPLI